MSGTCGVLFGQDIKQQKVTGVRGLWCTIWIRHKTTEVTGVRGLWCTIWIRHKTTEGNRCVGPVVHWFRPGSVPSLSIQSH